LVNYTEAYRRQRTDSGDTRRQDERVKRQEKWKKEEQRISVAAWWAVVRGLVPGRGRLRTLVCMLISRLVSTPPYIPCWQSRFPSVLNGNIPVTRRTYPDLVLPERNDAHEKEREPHARGGANSGHIMAFGTDARVAVNDLELVLNTKKEGDTEKHMGIGEYSEYASKRCATSVLQYDMVRYGRRYETRRDEMATETRHGYLITGPVLLALMLRTEIKPSARLVSNSNIK